MKNFISKILEPHRLSKQELLKRIDRAKEEERKRVREEEEEKFRHEKEKIIDEYNYELALKDSLIKQLGKEKEQIKEWAKEVEDVWLESTRQAKENTKLTALLEHAAITIRDSGARNYTSIVRLLDSAKTNEKQIETDHEKNMEKLRFKGRG